MTQGVQGRLRPRIFLTFRHYKGGRSSAKRTGRLYPRRSPWYSLSEDESTSGHMVLSGEPQKKSPVTPPGIDPGTVRLVAQCLNHYATRGLSVEMYVQIFQKNLMPAPLGFFFSWIPSSILHWRWRQLVPDVTALNGIGLSDLPSSRYLGVSWPWLWRCPLYCDTALYGWIYRRFGRTYYLRIQDRTWLTPPRWRFRTGKNFPKCYPRLKENVKVDAWSVFTNV